MKRLALWALVALILADLVPVLNLDTESNISRLSLEARRLYGDWTCPHGAHEDGACIAQWQTVPDQPGDWRILPDQPGHWKLQP